MPRAVNTAAIERATGKPWQEWLVWLEDIGAATLTQEEIAQKVYEQNVPNWWAKQVADAYGQETGRDSTAG